MFKKTVRFEDFNGDTVEKDFYFHMSKSELLSMAADGNAMVTRIKRIVEANDGKAILEEFRDFIKASVGVRSEDGQRFLKDKESQSHLLDSPAFDELLMELCTDAKASADFVKKLIPEKMQKEMQQKLQEQDAKSSGVSVTNPFKEPEDDRPAYQKENRHPTNAEMLAMSKQELAQAFAWQENRTK